MRFLERKVINERLRLATRQSFRVLKGVLTNNAGVIATSDIVNLMNGCAYLEQPISEIPFDLLTAEEIATETGISSRRILKATKRNKNPLPHYHFNNWTIRIRRSTFDRWIEGGHRNLGKVK